MQHKLKISLSDFAFHRFGLFSYQLNKVFAFAHEAKFDGIELNESMRTRMLGAKYVRQLIAKYDMPVTSVHHSFFRMGFATLGSIKKLLAWAQGLRAKCAVVHLGSVHRSLTNDTFFQKVKKLEKQYGVPVAFENAMAQFARFKPRELWFKHHPDDFHHGTAKQQLTLTYDLGHMAPMTQDIVGYYERLKDRLLNIHLQDYRAGFDHRPLGSGTLPLRSFLQHLSAHKYKGLITLEVFPLNRSPFMSMSRVQSKLKESLAFFREHTT